VHAKDFAYICELQAHNTIEADSPVDRLSIEEQFRILWRSIRIAQMLFLRFKPPNDSADDTHCEDVQGTWLVSTMNPRIASRQHPSTHMVWRHNVFDHSYHLPHQAHVTSRSASPSLALSRFDKRTEGIEMGKIIFSLSAADRPPPPSMAFEGVRVAQMAQATMRVTIFGFPLWARKPATNSHCGLSGFRLQRNRTTSSSHSLGLA